MIKLLLILVTVNAFNQVHVKEMDAGRYATVEDCHNVGMGMAEKLYHELGTRQATYICDKELPWRK